jgi:hypothetical protein
LARSLPKLAARATSKRKPVRAVVGGAPWREDLEERRSKVDEIMLQNGMIYFQFLEKSF